MVERGTWRGLGDALDRMGPRVVELLGVVSLVGGELRASSYCSPAGADRGEPAGVGDDELSVEFGQDGKHFEHRTSFRGRGVDALLEDT